MNDDVDEEEREVEIDSLQAIFPELVRHGPYSFSLEIPVALTTPVKVFFPATEVASSTPISLHDTLSYKLASLKPIKQEAHHLWNLPPLQVSAELVGGYPSQCPPKIIIRMTESWLPTAKIEELQNIAPDLWEEFGRDQILYTYVERLKEVAEDCFSLPVDGTLDVPADLKVALLDYDAEIKKAKFDNETFDCGVCLEPKKGVACHRLLSCGHVFCVPCLQGYYDSCITEGDVEGVKCINPDCGKEPTGSTNSKKRRKRQKRLQPSELLQIPIAEDLVQRYVRLRKKRRLEANPNTVYCPRKWGQGPARMGDGDSSDGSSAYESDNENNDKAGAAASSSASATGNRSIADKTADDDLQNDIAKHPKLRPPSECLAVCTDCSFAFCVICKRSWHGELGYCAVRNEKMFSREEKASEEYLKRHTTPCPTCQARSQKSMGCNHMICRQCNTHFCYLCSSWLDSGNPYSHFNTAGAPCYQRLWELEGGDGEGAPGRPQPPPIEVIFEDAPQDDENNGPPPDIPPIAPQPPPRRQDVRVRGRMQQGPAQPAPLVPPANGNNAAGQGLQRFLQLAQRDEEDGWDSDELEDQFVQFVLRDQ